MKVGGEGKIPTGEPQGTQPKTPPKGKGLGGKIINWLHKGGSQIAQKFESVMKKPTQPSTQSVASPLTPSVPTLKKDELEVLATKAEASNEVTRLIAILDGPAKSLPSTMKTAFLEFSTEQVQNVFQRLDLKHKLILGEQLFNSTTEIGKQMFYCQALTNSINSDLSQQKTFLQTTYTESSPFHFNIQTLIQSSQQ